MQAQLRDLTRRAETAEDALKQAGAERDEFRKAAEEAREDYLAACEVQTALVVLGGSDVSTNFVLQKANSAEEQLRTVKDQLAQTTRELQQTKRELEHARKQLKEVQQAP